MKRKMKNLYMSINILEYKGSLESWKSNLVVNNEILINVWKFLIYFNDWFLIQSQYHFLLISGVAVCDHGLVIPVICMKMWRSFFSINIRNYQNIIIIQLK